MAIEFTRASANYIQVPDSATLSIVTNLSISFWLNWVDLNDYAAIVDRRRTADANDNFGFSVYVTNTDTIRFKVGDGVTTYDSFSDGAISTGWHHIFCNYNGANLLLYYDAVLQADQHAFSGNIDYTGVTYMDFAGTVNNVANRYYSGKLDDLRIYNRSLSLNEIKTIYNSPGHDGIINGLKGRWTMNEGPSGAIAIGTGTCKDISGNANHGTPTGSPVYASSILSIRG